VKEETIFQEVEKVFALLELDPPLSKNAVPRVYSP